MWISNSPGAARLTTYRPDGEGYEVTRSVLAQRGTVCEFARPGEAPVTAFAGRAEVDQVDADGRLLSRCPLPPEDGSVKTLEYHRALDRLLVQSDRHLTAVEPRSGDVAGQVRLTGWERVEITDAKVVLHKGEQSYELGADLQVVSSDVCGPDVHGTVPLDHGVTAQFLHGSENGTLELRRAADRHPFRTFRDVGEASLAVAPDGRLLFTANGSRLVAYDPATDTAKETPLRASDAALVPLRDGRVLVKDASDGVFTVDQDGKTKVFLREAADVHEAVLSPDERQALVRVGDRVYLLNLEDNLFTRRARVIAESEDDTLVPCFLKDGRIALRRQGGVEILGEGLLTDPAAIRQLEVGGPRSGEHPVLARRKPEIPDLDRAEQLDFRTHADELPAELGPKAQRLLAPAVGGNAQVQLQGKDRTATVYIEGKRDPVMGCRDSAARDAEFVLPAPPHGLLALPNGAVLTRAGDTLAVLEPYQAPGEDLRGPDVPLPLTSAAGEIVVAEDALTIGNVTLARQAG